MVLVIFIQDSSEPGGFFQRSTCLLFISGRFS